MGAVVILDPEAPGPGIITERDLVRSLGAGQDPDTEAIGDHLTTTAVFADASWPVEDTADVMARGGFRHLVVVEDGELTGIISMRDLIHVWRPGAVATAAADRRRADDAQAGAATARASARAVARAALGRRDEQHRGGHERPGDDRRHQPGGADRVRHEQVEDPAVGHDARRADASEMAPAVAEPATSAGIIRAGLRAAKGMAPSVMKASPSTKAGLPASRSSGSQRLRNRTVARARPSGGVMPAAITAAIGPVTPRVDQPDGERVGHLVERAAHVEGHHRPEHQRRGGPRWCPAGPRGRSVSCSCNHEIGSPIT